LYVVKGTAAPRFVRVCADTNNGKRNNILIEYFIEKIMIFFRAKTRK